MNNVTTRPEPEDLNIGLPMRKNMKDSSEPDGTDVDATLQGIRSKAISAIMQGAEADTALLDILVKHIVTSSPARDAVEQAAGDIRKLAEERARS